MSESNVLYLVLDDRIIDSVENLSLVLGNVDKHPANPLFREEYFADPARPWEARYDNFYPNVVHNRGERCFRLWYNVFTHDSPSERTPLSARPRTDYVGKYKRTDGLLYAVSEDGINWTKPDLGLVDFDGSARNNIVMSTATHGLHGAGVLFDPDDPDPERRYKAFFRNSGARRMAVAFSSDGLHWAEAVNWPEHDAVGDTHNNAIRMPDGTFVGITRAWVGPRDQRVRAVLRTESQDFIHWSEPQEVLRGAGPQDQIYSMPIFRYGSIYLGLPAVFHKGDPDASDWDTVDTELAWSPDTVTWHRVCPGEPFIPLGEGSYPGGSYDCGCVYASAPVFVGDSHYIYYGGSNGLHNGFREGSFCLSVMERDRFAGYGAGTIAGRLVTVPIALRGGGFSLNGVLTLRYLAPQCLRED